MSQFKINSITNNNGNHGPVISGVSTNNSTGCMIIPAGNTGRRVEYNTVNDNDIVRDGLVLYLDFANPDCLIDGTTVRDLSGAGHHPTGTISGATYSSDGGGSLLFAGNSGVDFGTVDPEGPFVLSSSGIGITNTDVSSGGDKLTVCAWVGNVDTSEAANVTVACWSDTATSGWLAAVNETNDSGNRPMPAMIVSDGGDSTGNWSRPGWNGPNIPQYDPRTLSYWQTVKSLPSNSGIGNTTIAVGKDKFNHLTQRLVRDQVNGIWGVFTHINGLVNGMETPLFASSGNGYGVATESGDWGVGRSLRIGRTDSDTSTSNMSGNIAIVMVYNKSLSDAEITQNFNAQRYRFGR